MIWRLIYELVSGNTTLAITLLIIGGSVLIILFIILIAKFLKHLDYLVLSGKEWLKRIGKFFWWLFKLILKLSILPLYLYFFKKKVNNSYNLIINRNMEKDHVEYR